MICGHEPCGCVGGADGYCGMRCRSMAADPQPMAHAGEPTGTDCGCGHDACYVQVPTSG
jgi:hypothetical protein